MLPSSAYLEPSSGRAKNVEPSRRSLRMPSRCWATFTHLQLVRFGIALLTHLRIVRTGAQGHRTHRQAASMSTAATQDEIRRVIWNDLITSLQEKSHGEAVIQELERLRVA